jgi:hypothetical protein
MRLNIVSAFPAALSLLLLLFGAYWWGHNVLDPAYVSSTGLLGGGGLGVAESLAWFPCLFFSWLFGLSAAFFGRRYRLALLNTLIYGVISLESWEIATSRSLDLPLHGVVVTCHPT